MRDDANRTNREEKPPRKAADRKHGEQLSESAAHSRKLWRLFRLARVRTSPRRPAAVDDEAVARDKRGAVGEKEERGANDLVAAANAA